MSIRKPRKVIYVSFCLHANMSYDRYTKQTILEYFPRIYRRGVEILKTHPKITAHIDLSGITIRMLQRKAPDVLDGLRILNERGQIALAGCQYAASANVNTDELTTFEACRVGLEILRETINPKATGFFSQELSYHSQLPWILKQLGVEWMILRGWKKSRFWPPVRVRGLDGTTISTIMLNADISQLKNLCRRVEDKTFLLLGTDFEDLPDFVGIQKHIGKIAQNLDIDILFNIMPRWLKEHGQPNKVVNLEPFGNGTPELLELRSFSRWVLKPLDIRMRHYSLPAMAAIRRAKLITGALQEKVDIPIAQTVSPAVDNPWDVMFEHALEFPEDEHRYLSHRKESTALSRAHHHLLIGVNSDAIGWASWEPRWQHRIGELARARILADQIVNRALDTIATNITIPQTLKKAERFFLVFNPTRARTAIVSAYVPRPGSLLTPSGKVLSGIIRSTGTQYIITTKVSLPGYGYSLLGFKSGSISQESPWTEGQEIVRGALSVSLEGKGIKLRIGKRSAYLFIPPFQLEDPSHVCGRETISPDFSQAYTRVRKTPFGPQMELFHKTAWGMQTRLKFTLEEENLLCEVDFWFYLPRWVGGRGWNPEGLQLELVGEPGDLWYSIPFGVVKHRGKKLTYVAMHRFAALQNRDGGMAILPSSGVQGIKAIPEEGRLALRLGASALGELDSKPYITFNEMGDPSHHQHQTAAVFTGHHKHRFAIYLYKGNWAEADLPEKGRQFQESPVLQEVKPSFNRGTRPSVNSLLTIEPRSVDIAGFRMLNGQVQAILYETRGRPAKAILRIGKRFYHTNLGPWGIAMVEIAR